MSELKLQEQPGQGLPPFLLADLMKKVKDGKLPDAREQIKTGQFSDAQLQTIDNEIDRTEGLKASNEDAPATPAKLERKLKTKFRKNVINYEELYNVEYQTQFLLDKLEKAIDKAISVATEHRMKKLRAKDSWFPLVAPIQSVLQGMEFNKIMGRIKKIYLDLPEEERNKTIAEFAEIDKISPHRGQKALLTGSAMKTGGAGLWLGASAGAAATGGLLLPALSTLGLLSLVSGAVTSIVGANKTYTSIADTENAIRKLEALCVQIKTHRGNAKPDEMPKKMIDAAEDNIAAMSLN